MAEGTATEAEVAEVERKIAQAHADAGAGGQKQGDERFVGARGTRPPVEVGDDALSKIDLAASSAKAAQAMPEDARVDALSWLLEASDEEGEDTRTETWDFNVGTEVAPLWLSWTIRPVDADAMNQLRAWTRTQSGGNRQQRRSQGELNFDVSLFNLRMVAFATVEPNLAEGAQRKNIVSADPLEGPMKLVKHAYRNKPGIVDQIATKIMLLSGYDEEDVRRHTPEVQMVRAAGNS